MAWIRRLATIATAAEAARRYAKKNPDQAAKYVDQAAAFVDKQTKGRYAAQIGGVAQKVKNVAGVSRGPGTATPGGPANGYAAGAAPGYGAPQPGSATAPPNTPPPPSGTSTGASSASAPTTPVAKPPADH
jgi:MT0933-like antitoxin protein